MWIPLLLLLLSSCATKTEQQEPGLYSIQLIDRNGFSETISSTERLKNISQLDFSAPQPYQKVLRVFAKGSKAQSRSVLTTYHPNGHIHQMLEIKDGRANGDFKEWFPNGQLKIHSQVMEGSPEVTEAAQMSWVFDGKSTVWDDQNNCMAEIYYSKGALHNKSVYYYPNGAIEKTIPYEHNLIHGDFECFDEDGIVIETIPFREGEKEGVAQGFWDAGLIRYRETYNKGLLVSGEYYTTTGEKIAQVEHGEGTRALFDGKSLEALIEYHGGVPQGKVTALDRSGFIETEYYVKDGQRNGVETRYYPRSKQPKLAIEWRDDNIHGITRTWYENGAQESQREFSSNKKHGVCLAWYRDGELMLAEEYENDILVKGAYFKKGDKHPTSRIEGGKGVATLYDKQGIFLKKVSYEKGHPVSE